MRIICAVVVVLLGPGCGLLGTPCEDTTVTDIEVELQDSRGNAIDDATVTLDGDGEGPRDCPRIARGRYACSTFPLTASPSLLIVGPGYRQTETLPLRVTDRGDSECSLGRTDVLLVEIDDVIAPRCCCASIVEGDIVEEAPAENDAACAAREQGSCVDQATVDARLTPHACCPDATGERCGA